MRFWVCYCKWLEIGFRGRCEEEEGQEYTWPVGGRQKGAESETTWGGTCVKTHVKFSVHWSHSNLSHCTLRGIYVGTPISRVNFNLVYFILFLFLPEWPNVSTWKVIYQIHNSFLNYGYMFNPTLDQLLWVIRSDIDLNWACRNLNQDIFVLLTQATCKEHIFLLFSAFFFSFFPSHFFCFFPSIFKPLFPL